MLKRYLVVFLILFLAVGYAGISTKNLIDGNINIGYDDSNFIIEFTNNDAYNGTSSINNNGKTLNFKTKKLNNIDDESILHFSIANKSINYDALVEVNCELKDNSISLIKYFDLTSDIKNPINLEAGEEKDWTLTIKMKESYSSGTTPEVICTFIENPSPRDKPGNKYIPQYKDPILNGADPTLGNDRKLVPVTISDNGTVTYANTKEAWYNYETKEWANAVILINNPSKTYNVNDIIAESDIESYFVWIPRFRYKIFNEGNYNEITNIEKNEQTIEIQFEDKSVVPSKGTTKGSWLTHPAFLAFDSNGFWASKFEAGYKGATTKTAAEINSSDHTKLQIKPNVYSWRSITVDNAFKVSFEYQRNLESHMMKNTEWGAVAYLSHSIYGNQDNIRINNNSNLLTGYAAVKAPTVGFNKGAISTAENQYGTSSNITQPYNTTTGYKASTTGNITGIYDMSGGAAEYVAGYNINASNVGGGSNITSHYQDFFTNNKWNKYYDKYSNNNDTSYSNRILGDATGEMGPFKNVKDSDGGTRPRSSWYGDYALMTNSSIPWCVRGGSWKAGVVGGIFAFHRHSESLDGTSPNGSFRIVLTPY